MPCWVEVCLFQVENSIGKHEKQQQVCRPLRKYYRQKFEHTHTPGKLTDLVAPNGVDRFQVTD